MVLDNTHPSLSVSRIEGLDSTGVAKTILKAGDTLSVTLSASEAVRVTEGGT
jgi:hypothetical protein